MDFKAIVSEAIQLLAAREDVATFSLIGSASYLPSHACEDVDFVVLVAGTLTAKDVAGDLLEIGDEEGWVSCSNYDIPAGPPCGADTST